MRKRTIAKIKEIKMTEDMEKRVNAEREETAYMKNLNDAELLHELSEINNDYISKRVNKIISKLSSIDTLKEENRVAEIDIKKWMVWHDELEAKVEELEAKAKEGRNL